METGEEQGICLPEHHLRPARTGHCPSCKRRSEERPGDQRAGLGWLSLTAGSGGPSARPLRSGETLPSPAAPPPRLRPFRSLAGCNMFFLSARPVMIPVSYKGRSANEM